MNLKKNENNFSLNDDFVKKKKKQFFAEISMFSRCKLKNDSSYHKILMQKFMQ